MMRLMIIVVAVVILTRSLFSRIHSIQPSCADISALFGFYLTLMLSNAHQQTHQLTQPSLRLSMIELMIIVVSGSKNCQKVERFEKP